MPILTTSNSIKRKKRNDATGITRLMEQRSKAFIAYDGEGYTTPNGEHIYALFGNSLGARITGSLNWRNCFPLMFAAPKNAHHVIFSGTYDVVMMFKDEELITRLLQGKPCYFDQYRVTYLRGKMLRVTDRERKETRTLYDVFSFFGKSFVKACEEYLGNSNTLAEIADMKAKRSTFNSTDIEGAVDEYMSKELTLLVELCEALRSRLAAVGIHPRQWHGPGAVASTVLRDKGIKGHKGSYSEEFRKYAEAAYYGGRFEQFQRGTYEGTVYQYDIRSAYPYAMSQLPSLANVIWQETGPTKLVMPYGLYELDYVNPSPNYFDIGYLPHRSKAGNIYYPPHFQKGIYWGVEIPDHMFSSITRGWIPNTIEGKPFDFVEEMYEERAKLKREGKPQQLALKLALNSLYGKLAQSKGAEMKGEQWAYPSFHEVVWAGLITAMTRKMISDALHSVDRSNIISTETDSIFSLVPLDLPLGEKLGNWDCEILEGVKYIQSGVCLVKKQGQWSFKTRGFTVKRQQNEVEIWNEFLTSNEPMRIKQTRFGTDPRQATFGKWFDTIHKLSIEGSKAGKRQHYWCPNCDEGLTYADCLHWLSCPPIPYSDSFPYSFTWRKEREENPMEQVLNDPTAEMEYL